jgi:carboxypeptidase PM20D1
MMKTIWKVLLGGLAVIGMVLAYNVYKHPSKQVRPPLVKNIPVPDGAVANLSAAVRLSTVSYSDRLDTAAFQSLVTLIDTTYPLVKSRLSKTLFNDFSHILHWSGKNAQLKPILLIAHLDVVPVSEQDASKWKVPPFSGDVRDGYIWGRGTLDDKVSAFGILEAVEMLLQAGYQPNRSIYIAFGHDEEVGGTNGAKEIAQFFKDQGITFEFVVDEGSIILNNALKGLQPPLAMIGIAEKGYTTVTLTAQGEGGHSSMPPPHTAIGILSKAICRLEDNPMPASTEGPLSLMLETLAPEMQQPYRTVFSNLWLFEGVLKRQLSAGNASNAIVRTTTAPTMLQAGIKDNVLPTTASATVNFRIRPTETVDDVLRHVRHIIADERITLTADEHSNNPSPVSSAGSFGYHVIETTIRELFEGVVVAPSLVIATTDSRHYQVVAEQVYRFLPLWLDAADLERIHGIDERIAVENYKSCIRFYHRLIRNGSL